MFDGFCWFNIVLYDAPRSYANEGLVPTQRLVYGEVSYSLQGGLELDFGSLEKKLSWLIGMLGGISESSNTNLTRVLRDDPTKSSMHNREGLSVRALFEALCDWRLWPLYALGITHMGGSYCNVLFISTNGSAL